MPAISANGLSAVRGRINQKLQRDCRRNPEIQDGTKHLKESGLLGFRNRTSLASSFAGLRPLRTWKFLSPVANEMIWASWLCRCDMRTLSISRKYLPPAAQGRPASQD